MKKTPWFDRYLMPARDGVYERAFEVGRGFSRYEKGRWYFRNKTVEGAQAATMESGNLVRWRGLTKPT